MDRDFEVSVSFLSPFLRELPVDETAKINPSRNQLHLYNSVARLSHRCFESIKDLWANIQCYSLELFP